MIFPVLETERFILKEITSEHTSTIFSIFSNEDVIRYYGMSPFTSIEQATEMIQSFAKNFELKRSIRWGITWRETGELVGTIGLNNLSILNKKAEVGYDLLPEYWRKGIISEALEAVISYSFNKLDLYRIGAVTFPENKPSYTLLKKAGFQKEGLLRGYLYQNNQSHDAYIFSLIKPDKISI